MVEHGFFSFLLDKKMSMCFDSGMPSITSDSVSSQVLSTSDYDDRSAVLQTQNRSPFYAMEHRRLTCPLPAAARETNWMVPTSEQPSSEEDGSRSSAATRFQQAKTLVYEVIV
jgi:hypothetical protein